MMQITALLAEAHQLIMSAIGMVQWEQQTEQICSREVIQLVALDKLRDR